MFKQIDTNKMNRDADREQKVKEKVMALQGLFYNLNASLTKLVEETEGTKQEKDNLWIELRDKASAELGEVSAELVRQRRLLTDIQTGQG